MLYFSNPEMIIRSMSESDVRSIVEAEREQSCLASPEKYFTRLKDQENWKNIALVAKFRGEVAGFVYVYPYGLHGEFDGEGYPEIVDLTVFKKYQNFGIENELRSVAEKIASEYSDTVYTSVRFKDGKTLHSLVVQGYVPDRRGFVYKNKSDFKCRECLDEDEISLLLYKHISLSEINKLLALNTPECPSFKLLEDRTYCVYGVINSEKYQKLRVNDEVFLTDKRSNAQIRCHIAFRYDYNSFEDLFSDEGVENLLPFLDRSKEPSEHDKNLADCRKFFNNLPGTKLAQKYGCVAFGLKVAEVTNQKIDRLSFR